jgi:XTP/dITP diphosphohydrolase
LTEELLLATTNLGKASEIGTYLEGLPLGMVSLQELDLQVRFQEKAKSFMENARGKSLFYSRSWEGLTLGEDSGLEVEFLHGSPGVISARFSGLQATDANNIAKVLELMQGVPWEQRKARFVSTMVLSQKSGVITEIEECVHGYITLEEKGDHGFGYDPIFFYPPLNRTFGELPPTEKNHVSHRGRALKKLKLFLEEYLSP